MRKIFLALICSAVAAAQVTNVRVLGTTPTQAILSYVAPTSQSCKVEVSPQAGYAPLVPDVDGSLFPGDDRDDRAGAIATGRSRTFVTGKTQVDRAASGAKYSRALQVNTDHYFRVTCGSDTATGAFRTLNIPTGKTHMDALQADTVKPGAYLSPSNNLTMFPEIIDPKTGVLIKNIDNSSWAYSAASPSTGVTFADALDPSGNWATPAFALASDTNWASYSGALRDWLWLRLNYYPDSSTFTQNDLSFQNIIIEARCSGTDCGTGGELLDVCITRLGIDNTGAHCEDPIRTIALTQVMTPVTVCGTGAPCVQPAKPGDVFTFDRPPKGDSWVSDGYVYNTVADYTKLFFTNINDCKRLWPNETISMWMSNLSLSRAPTILTLNCLASPAQATMNTALPMDMNGATGVPFNYNTGISGNPRYGVLLRKASATANSTISVNSVKWVGASSITTTFANGSGGFSRVCTKKTDANGFYHCHAGAYMIAGIRTEVDGSLTVRFLGVSYVLGQTVFGMTGGFTLVGAGPSDFMWDDADPNVFYFSSPSGYSSGGTLFVKATYTGNDVACGQSGSLCPAPSVFADEFSRWPKLPATYQPLNPCLNSCSLPSDDMSIEGQLTRYTATKGVPYNRSSFPSCGVEAVQGNTVVATCRQGQQDSYAWVFALDIGNGLPIGAGYLGRFGNTQHVFAAAPLFAPSASRWCTLHTYQNIRAEGIATPEFQNEKNFPFNVTETGSLPACTKPSASPGTCNACPSVTVNGFNYTGKTICGTLNTSTAWDVTWGIAPSSWQAGEPVSALPSLHWLQPLTVGDVVTSTGELMRVLQKLGPSQYVVERGVGPDQSYQFPRAHSGGEVWTTVCEPPGAHWFYELDSDANGSGTTYLRTSYVNHGLGRDGVRVRPDYEVSLAPFTTSEMGNSSYESAITMPGLFAGKASNANGNSIEKHPSYGQEDAPAYNQTWFADGHPYLFTGNAGSSAFSAIKISADLYKYRFSGTIDAKYFDVAAFSGNYPLREASGPSSVITGGTVDAYKLCRSLVANECVTGSVAGDIYVNVPAMDLTQNFCKEGEFFAGWRGICVANFNLLGASYAQWALPSSGGKNMKNFAGSRVVTRIYEPYSGSSTTNGKPTPDGRWLLLRSNLIVKLPPFPQTDSVSRATFVPVVVDLAPPVKLGATNAVVEFGYTTDFYCTPRTEKCVATKSAVDESNPFVWPTEVGGDAGVTGLACSTGCRITIPAISGKVLYYRWKYRNASQLVLAASVLQVTAVP